MMVTEPTTDVITCVCVGSSPYESDFQVSDDWISAVKKVLNPHEAHSFNADRCIGTQIAKLHL